MRALSNFAREVFEVAAELSGDVGLQSSSKPFSSVRPAR
jgi:hypothetical protein